MNSDFFPERELQLEAQKISEEIERDARRFNRAFTEQRGTEQWTQ